MVIPVLLLLTSRLVRRMKTVYYMQKIILLLILAGMPLAAEDPKIELAAAKAEIALLKARSNWCSQEMDIWKRNIPVMEVRLELAREEAKAAEREKAAKAKPVPASSASAPAQ